MDKRYIGYKDKRNESWFANKRSLTEGICANERSLGTRIRGMKLFFLFRCHVDDEAPAYISFSPLLFFLYCYSVPLSLQLSLIKTHSFYNDYAS